MRRQVISIEQDKCTGCGLCIPNCPEGAIQMIDGKARVVNLSLCDGLGACVGHPPERAITTKLRDTEEYDEIAQRAARAARRRVPIKHVVVGAQGSIRSERWV